MSDINLERCDLLFVSFSGNSKQTPFFSKKGDFQVDDVIELNREGFKPEVTVKRVLEYIDFIELDIDLNSIPFIDGELVDGPSAIEAEEEEPENEQEENSIDKLEESADEIDEEIEEKENEEPEVEANLSLFNIEVDMSKYFSFLEYHTGNILKTSDPKLDINVYSLIKRIVIDNQSGKKFDDVIIKVTFSNSVFTNFIQHAYNIKNDFKHLVELKSSIMIDGNKLYSQNGVDTCDVCFECFDAKDNLLLDSITRTFTILPIRQSSEDSDFGKTLWCKYCVTGFKKLKELHQLAIEENDNKPIIGYQNVNYDGTTDKETIVQELCALYNAVHKYGINYSNPPNSIGVNQNIRLPVDVLNERQATCLDFSIMFCSLLLEVGYHPILLLIEGHAMVGCFLNEEDYFDGFINKKKKELIKRAIAKNNSIILINITDAHASSNFSLIKAKYNAELLLKDTPFVDAFDVSYAQKSGYAPIPIPDDSGEIDFKITPVEIDDSFRAENEYYVAKLIEGDYSKDRFTTWERKLLELTTRNKLVNFSHLFVDKLDPSFSLILGYAYKVYSLFKKSDGRIIGSTLEDLFTGNVNGYDSNQVEIIVNDKIKKGEIYLKNSSTNIKKIIKKNKSSIEEAGAPTLYMAFGGIRTVDVSSKKKNIIAPLLLLPINMHAKSYGHDFEITYDFEEIMINQTFFEYIKLKRQVDFKNIYSFDGQKYELQDLENSIKEIDTNNIVDVDIEVCWIANFSFSHYVMWKDIKDRKNDLKKNEIVQSLLQNKSVVEKDDYFDDKSSDELDRMSNFAAPLPYDSTQLRAIIECGRGKSFVLDGPPGTGKSQTIVNMIVNALYQGKTVLFVAEKAAALDVVRNRLERLSLDRFVLDIYGPNFSKKTILEKYRMARNLANERTTSSIEETLLQIDSVKKKINDNLVFLHKKNESEGEVYSLYEAIVDYKATIEFKRTYIFDQSFLLSLTSEKDDRIRNNINEVTKLLQLIPDYSNNPLRFFKCKSFGYIDQEKLPIILESVKSCNDNLLKTFANLKEMLGIEMENTLDNVDFLIKLSKAISNIPNHYLKVFENSNVFTEMRMESYFNTAATKIEFIKTHSDNYDLDNLIKVDTTTIEFLLASQSFFNKIKLKRHAKSCLSSILKIPLKLSVNEITRIIEVKNKYKKIDDSEKKNREVYSKVFQEDDLSPNTVNKNKNIYLILKELYFMLDKIRVKDEKFYLNIAKALYKLNNFQINQAAIIANKCQVEFDGLMDKINDLYTGYDFDRSFFNMPGYSLNLVTLYEYSNDDRKMLELSNIARFNKTMVQLCEDGASDLIYESLSKGVEYSNLIKVYSNSLSCALIEHYYSDNEKESYFNNFNSMDYEELIDKYISLINDYNSLSVRELIYKNTIRINKIISNPGCIGTIGELNKLSTSSRNGYTIRRILDEFEDYFRAYFPCFIMSPMEAARLLGTGSKKFDIVIFDEASQIPTSEAVGPIARGKSLIVAGDPKQMPPSNYFGASLSSGEETEIIGNEDSESFLDDCIAIELPLFHLSFHYRSRHESLIQFSNSNFYNDGLYTFPSADNLNCHVNFKYVEVDKKTNGITEKEVHSIINEFKKVSLDKKNKSKSVGIIVFNTQQQETIEEELEKEIDRNPILRKALSDQPEKYFVKNLENVQGDERDIIILSVGFGKSSTGKAILSGPLIAENGERRLNVAASRAKDQMIVISTIKSSEVDASKSKNKGPLFLKKFLSFAEASSNLDIEDINENSSLEIASFIKEDLEAVIPNKVDLYIGNSDFKVDIAIRDEETNEYLLGILLDQHGLSDRVSCRDRFYVQNTILNGLKWKIVRVYTVQYHRNPRSTIENIIDKLNKVKEEMLQQKDNQNEVIEEVVEEVPKELSVNFVPYQRYSLMPRDYIDYSSLLKGFYSEALERLIYNIVDTEGPVSFKRILEVCKESFGIKQAKSLAREKVQSFINLNNFDKTIDGETVFYWKKDSSKNINFFRKDPNRDLSDTPKEEILYLLNCIIEFKGTINQDDLIKEFLQILDIQSGRIVMDRLIYTINYFKEKGLLKEGYCNHY